MTVYSISVFLHIVGALGLFAAFGLEWAGLLGIRRAATGGQAREGFRLLGATRVVGAPSALIILITGLYLALSAPWGRQAWIGLGLVGLVLIAVLGATLTGRRVRSIARTLPAEGAAIAPAFGVRLRDPVLILSALLRTALALGIVFIMATKPSDAEALTALGVALVLGAAAAAVVGGGSRREVEGHGGRAS